MRQDKERTNADGIGTKNNEATTSTVVGTGITGWHAVLQLLNHEVIIQAERYVCIRKAGRRAGWWSNPSKRRATGVCQGRVRKTTHRWR